MPADDTLPPRSDHHRDGARPYPCSQWERTPTPAWAIDYGYCRTSLDWHGPGSPQGQGDPRCPADCQHKAPVAVAKRFSRTFIRAGAVAAAAEARRFKERNQP